MSALESLNLIHIGEGAVSKQRSKAVGDVGEIRVSESRRQKRLKPYDRLLKSFKYSAALDSVLRKVCVSYLTLKGLLNRVARMCPLPQHSPSSRNSFTEMV